MNSAIILRVTTHLLTPLIVLFALYVQIHGEQSPGGGFQAGVILASVFILHALLWGPSKTLKIFPISVLKFLCCLGVLIYSGTGLAGLVLHGHFLEYAVLAKDRLAGQHLGIFLIELGIGCTVCSAMLIIFFMLAQRDPA